MSRIGRPIWSDKPLFLLGTSPGGRGAKKVLETAVSTFPHQGGKVLASFSLPSFSSNFNEEEGITNSELEVEFSKQLELFQKGI